MNLILAGEAPNGAMRPPAIVRRFLASAQAADTGERADAATALARAYRYGALSEAGRREAVTGLTAMLGDPSILVRRALAEALASAPDAPGRVILALANDLPEIAAIVIARSPMLTDADFVDCAAVGGEAVQAALAGRPGLSVGVAAALAEIGTREAILVLLENLGAALTERGLRRIAERFGEDGEIREKLLARPWLPATLRCDLVAATAKALSPLAAAFGLGEQRIEKIMREAREEGAVAVASATEGGDLTGLIRHLRATGALTVALLMRALVFGDRAFFEAAAAELSGLGPARVAAFARAPLGVGFAALYRRTGLPRRYLAPFRAALAALAASRNVAVGRVLKPVAQRAIAACKRPELHWLLALLRRLETEVALEEARAFAAEVATQHESPDIPPQRAGGGGAVESIYVLRKPPPLIAVNALGDIELLPAPIEALPVAAAA